MTTLLFLPNEHLLAWVYHARGVTPGEVMALVAAGGWPFPAEWRAALDDQFIVPTELCLHAAGHDQMVVIFPLPALREKIPGRLMHFSPAQTAVLRLMAQGLTTGQIAHTLKVRRRWVMYQVAAVKRRLGAATRAEAVSKRARG